MKCPICDGTGTSNTCVNGTFKPCSFCGGTGEVKDNLCETCGTICPFDDEHLECEHYTPLTNEGWFGTLSTEEKAEVLCNVVPELAYENDGVWYEKRFVEWLKEKHQ